MSKRGKSSKSDWTKVGPCLYRYKNGVYYSLLKHRGKQIRKSLETTDLPHARRLLNGRRNDVGLTDPTLSTRDLETHAERFLATLSGAEGTIENKTRSVTKLRDEWPTGRPRVLAKITKGDCEIWLKQYENLAAASVNQIITDARAFFDLAVGDKVIPRSPMDGITYRKRPSLTRLTPTTAEFEAIVADLRSQVSNSHGAEHSADFVALAGLLGLGQAELSGIERQHISLDAGTLKIFRHKTRQSFVIPIYPKARPIIERRMAHMPTEQTTRLLPYDDCKKGLEAACRRLKLPKYEPRALRRYFITQALRAGIDVPTVAAWQGHRDGGALILRTYGDEVRLDHSLRMAALLEGQSIGVAARPLR